MPLIDTHTHLDAEQFESDRQEVISRAQQAGLIYVLSIAVDLETTYKNLELAEKNSFIYASCGLHPNSGNLWSQELEEAFQEVVKHPKIVAVGETGLD
ncbi:MAG: TatD family hydrolase, partial [Planctomycetota bacterium]